MIIGPAFLGWWGLARASPQSGQAGPPPQVRLAWAPSCALAGNLNDTGRFWAEARTGPTTARPHWWALKAAPLKLARPMAEAARQLRHRSSDQLAGRALGKVTIN